MGGSMKSFNRLAEDCWNELRGAVHSPTEAVRIILRHIESAAGDAERLIKRNARLSEELDAERSTNARLTAEIGALDATTNRQSRVLTEQSALLDAVRAALASAPSMTHLRGSLPNIVQHLAERAHTASDFELMLGRVCYAMRDLTDPAITRVLQEANDLLKRKGASSPLRGPGI